MDSSPHPHSAGENLSPDGGRRRRELAAATGIPTYSAETTSANLRCCCGRFDCALLEHNVVALEGLEKDLETAARLGQVRWASFFPYHFWVIMYLYRLFSPLTISPRCGAGCDAGKMYWIGGGTDGLLRAGGWLKLHD